MMMFIYLKKYLKQLVKAIVIIALTLLVIRVYDSQKGTPLALWHKVIPQELTAKQITGASWDDYLKAEAGVFDYVKREVTDKLPISSQYSLNRYSAQSNNYPAHFNHDWNRSFLLKPEGPPKGAVALLHGLTDSPYSMRHLAYFYQAQGFVVVAIRMPAHGTVPAALSTVHWEDWLAATHLAVKEAQRYIDKDQPLHLVGYSNGAALAVMYTLETLDNPAFPKIDQLVLISPMIGVTSFARFAGVAGLPAIFPAFAKAAWVDVIPEYNPFKYNSFPVNGARQSYELTTSLQRRLLDKLSTSKGLQQVIDGFPPVLAFQSVVDGTVNSKSVVSGLFDILPNKGNELVLFDVNKTVYFNPLLTHRAYGAITELLPARARGYDTTVVGNVSADSNETAAYITKADQMITEIKPLPTVYPAHLYSLSHIALPFPETDSLYGAKPEILNEFGVSLGTVNIKGERGVLVTNLDNLLRISYNPFYNFMIEKINRRVSDSLHKNEMNK